MKREAHNRKNVKDRKRDSEKEEKHQSKLLHSSTDLSNSKLWPTLAACSCLPFEFSGLVGLRARSLADLIRVEVVGVSSTPQVPHLGAFSIISIIIESESSLRQTTILIFSVSNVHRKMAINFSLVHRIEGKAQVFTLRNCHESVGVPTTSGVGEWSARSRSSVIVKGRVGFLTVSDLHRLEASKLGIF